jgi:alanine dehydrogenase
VDVSIDQGGCVETARPTTHSDPVYVKHGVVHYCVTNIPGAVGMTSTTALANATLTYVSLFAAKGVKRAVKEDEAVAHALNIDAGRIVHPAVSAAFRGVGILTTKHRG